MGATCGCSENNRGIPLIDTDSARRTGRTKSRLALAKDRISLISGKSSILSTGLNTLLTGEEIIPLYNSNNYKSTKVTSNATLKVNINKARPFSKIVKGYHKLVRNKTPFALYITKNDSSNVRGDTDALTRGFNDITDPSKDTLLLSNDIKYIAPYQSIWIVSKDTIQLLFKIVNCHTITNTNFNKINWNTNTNRNTNDLDNSNEVESKIQIKNEISEKIENNSNVIWFENESNELKQDDNINNIIDDSNTLVYLAIYCQKSDDVSQDALTFDGKFVDDNSYPMDLVVDSKYRRYKQNEITDVWKRNSRMDGQLTVVFRNNNYWDETHSAAMIDILYTN